MDTETLIEQYHDAIETSNKGAALAIAAHLIGRRVVATVEWYGGHTSEVTGEVFALRGKAVYIATRLGDVEGDAMSMSAADEIEVKDGH
jgi:hypothetical protein